MNTLAFTVCFAAWVLNGVLVTFLVDNGVYQWSRAQLGWLIGAPVLTGALLRLPTGLLSDRYGGRLVITLLMIVAAVPMYLLGQANSYPAFLLASLGFGLSGACFAAGVSYTSVWFPAARQGTALGIFGMGTMGAGVTALIAPSLLRLLTNDGANLAAWRLLPTLYAGGLIATAIAFWLLTFPKKPAQTLAVAQRLAPLRNIRVWRFGLYYFFFFGAFVALAQWLIPYFVSVYSMPLAEAGLLVALFSLPAGVVRALGGWASDVWGARSILYLTFGGSIVLLLLLLPPRVEMLTPSQGVTADRPGLVTSVTDGVIVVDQDRYVLARAAGSAQSPAQIRFGIHAATDDEGFVLWPTTSFSQAPVVQVGESVSKGQLLARGETHIYFQANKWVFSGLTILLGLLMGIGSAAVFKHIPTYFPGSVGVVGGLIGTIGALGGFVYPIIFGYLLQGTGVWTTSWMFLLIVAVGCLVWMHVVIQRMMRAQVPVLVRQVEERPPTPGP